MKRIFVLGSVALLAACFDPSFHDTTCGPGGECPSGFTCAIDGVCRSDDPQDIDARDPDADDLDADDPDADETDVDAAIDAPDGFAFLTVTRTGDGTGFVKSSPDGIDCGETCTAAYAIGSEVTLEPTADIGSEFKEWGGACAGQGRACLLPINDATEVEALFGAVADHTLSVTVTGFGGGTTSNSVDIAPLGVSCSDNCQYAVPHSTTVTITPAPGVFVLGWTGDGGCTGTDSCTFVIVGDVTVGIETFP